MRFALLLAALLTCAPGLASPSPEPSYLYRATLLRAAPGRLLDLIDVLKTRRDSSQARGDHPFFWMRHSQGDQWDLLLLYPMESYAAFYHPDRLARRLASGAPDDAHDAPDDFVAWHEDLFAFGPPLATVREAFEEAGFFHVEMFQALPGLRSELLKEREMENVYLAALKRPQNLLFVRHQGAAWDAFTIGFYRDLKHFAESADIPIEQEQQAAREAGFESVYAISPYLRTLIREHHDTLAVAVR